MDSYACLLRLCFFFEVLHRHDHPVTILDYACSHVYYRHRKAPIYNSSRSKTPKIQVEGCAHLRKISGWFFSGYWLRLPRNNFVCLGSLATVSAPA